VIYIFSTFILSSHELQKEELALQLGRFKEMQTSMQTMMTKSHLLPTRLEEDKAKNEKLKQRMLNVLTAIYEFTQPQLSPQEKEYEKQLEYLERQTADFKLRISEVLQCLYRFRRQLLLLAGQKYLEACSLEKLRPILRLCIRTWLM
jgi:Nucleoporin complex subunit 54